MSGLLKIVNLTLGLTHKAGAVFLFRDPPMQRPFHLWYVSDSSGCENEAWCFDALSREDRPPPD